MAEITETAYTKIKMALMDEIYRVELRDENGNYFKRILVTDSNVNWIHPTREDFTSFDDRGNPIPETVPDSQTLQLEIVIKGSDIALPKTFASSALLDAFDFEISVEEFEPFTMTQEEDQITITHNIEVPQVTI